MPIMNSMKVVELIENSMRRAGKSELEIKWYLAECGAERALGQRLRVYAGPQVAGETVIARMGSR